MLRRAVYILSLTLMTLVIAAWVRGYFVGESVGAASSWQTRDRVFENEIIHFDRRIAWRIWNDSGWILFVDQEQRAMTGEAHGTFGPDDPTLRSGWKYGRHHVGFIPGFVSFLSDPSVGWKHAGAGCGKMVLMPPRTPYEYGRPVPIEFEIKETYFAIHCGWLVALFGIFSVFQTIIWLRRRRTRPGCCPRCGYDMRATPQRCPECGTAAALT